MKPAPFTYHRPSSVDEAAQILAEHRDDDARIIAGGQSLGAIMAFRLSQPNHLIDINEIAGLDDIHIQNDRLIIGATVRHARFHEPVEPGPLGHLLAKVVRSIAHFPIRTRGTFCGSLAHFDPASEWCLVAATLGAEVHVQSVRGRRVLRVEDHFVSAMVTGLESDELIVQVHLPLLKDGTVSGFQEFSRRKGDFAVAAALACYRLEEGLIADARIGVGGAEEVPRRIPAAEAALAGRAPTVELFEQAADIAAHRIEPIMDPQITEQYRRQLVHAMTHRALKQTLEGPAQ